MRAANQSKSDVPGALCLRCGLCCNGTIFSNVQLQPADDPALLASLGLELRRPRRAQPGTGALADSALAFLQPCAALKGCRCRIYASRPAYCRDFECRLLKKVKRHRCSRFQADRLVRQARRQAQKVRRLLRALGDGDEALALADRFRRITRRFEASRPDEPAAELYSRLTLAFHDLTRLIHEQFYAESPA